MKNKVWISKFTVNDGTTVTLDESSIVVFVGANNMGKSASLKEIFQLLKSNGTGKIITHVEIESIGNVDDLVESLIAASKQSSSLQQNPTFSGIGYSVPKDNLLHFWNEYRSGLSRLHSLFVNLLSTETRLTAANPAPNIAITSEPPSHPIHFLQSDDRLEERFSNYFYQAFGKQLILHRNAGSTVPLYVGDKPQINEGEDRISRGYLNKLEALPQLHLQGDGMRSFVGVLLSAFVSEHSIQLIDEPEAFLHPPQARLLGKMLAKDLPMDRQLFLSTHSEEFLKGLLDSGNQNVRIIRLRREGNINIVNQLNTQEINEIWSDSLLRHSNILNGLFHSKVIICESDSDCRFYSAVLYSLYENTNGISPDVLFIHCGGKHRIPVVIRALKSLGVPITVAVDFDILNSESPFKDILLELGGLWHTIKDDWRNVKSAIDSKKPELLAKDLKDEIEKAFSDAPTNIVSGDTIKKISSALKKSSPWSNAKQVGKSFIPSGEHMKAYDRLNDYASSLGIKIVEVGELEGFIRTIGNHGPKWVNEALKMDLKNDPEVKLARDFVRSLIT
ncbi:AAA family ATPase [Pedobacter sp. MC2016-15]|uniref:ATP-dependent nuclease n=1 Tax=Pedobacter sp. MC2016-15 TaxID=2994473 RepID=UPI0022464AB8|nr:AAA family ATPase [Pedobacter sp. MC2016-15]MCX2481051.1 AAA family ATPase [Pedobacter sp. MC2016-15]